MSCLFDSLSNFLNFNSNQIRQLICDYLESNKPIMEDLPTDFILSLDGDNYIKNMRKNNQWGGAIEIQAACNLFAIRIIIHNIRNNTYIEFIPITKKYIYTIEMSWNGSHYEPLRLRG
jgi:hypothetical protein